MSSISRQRLFHYFLLKYSDYFQHPIVFRSGWYLSVKKGYGWCRFINCDLLLRPPFGNIVLPQGLPEMRKNASQHGCWGRFCAPAAGICQAILHLSRYQLTAEERSCRFTTYKRASCWKGSACSKGGKSVIFLFFAVSYCPQKLCFSCKVGEWCVRRYVIFPKCKFTRAEKIRHCAPLGFTENPHSSPYNDFNISIRQPHCQTAHLFRVSPYPQPLRSVLGSSFS